MGCVGFALVATAAIAAHLWWYESGRSEPWTEYETTPSPDGRFVVYREGRSAFMDLETRVTIAQAGTPEPADRYVLVPWTGMWPKHIEWRSDDELVIVMSWKTLSIVEGHERLKWRSVDVAITYR